jgi:hypothetical protein
MSPGASRVARADARKTRAFARLVTPRGGSSPLAAGSVRARAIPDDGKREREAARATSPPGAISRVRRRARAVERGVVAFVWIVRVSVSRVV